MAKIPMKMRVIEWLKDNPCSNIDDIMVALKGEYAEEGQFSRLNFNHMMQAMKAIGIINNCKVEIDKAENVVVYFSLTDYGIKSMKYIPK